MTPRKPKRAKPSTVVVDGNLAFVHDRTWESRDQRRKHETMGFYVVQTYRVVCSCGWASKWNDDQAAVTRAADRHNVPGQLSMVLPGTRANT